MIQKNQYEKKQENAKYRNFKQIVNQFYNEEIEMTQGEEIEEIKNKGTIKIEPKFTYDKLVGKLKVEFKIGKQKMYPIKDLSEFYTLMLNKENHKYGEKLQFIHIKENFEEKSLELLEFILKYAEIIKYVNTNSSSNYQLYGKPLNENYIILNNSGIDEIFEILKNQKVEFQRDYNHKIIGFSDQNPPIEFSLKRISDEEYEIIPNIELFKINIIKGKKYKYILDENNLYRCDKEFEKTTLKLLEAFRLNYTNKVILSKEQLPELFSIILPKIKNEIKLENIKEEEIKQYRPQELEVKTYLDFDKNNYLIAEVKFCYGKKEFNPIDEKQEINIPRNKIKEIQSLNMLRKTGFMVDMKNLRFILPDEDKIYKFLTEDINVYMKRFEVLVTDNFKTKQIKEPKIGNIGIKIENNLLSIDLKQLNIDAEEIEEVMTKYKLKKKYHRLKDGTFITLEGNKEIEFIDKLITGMDIEPKKISNETIKLPINRSLYLNQLLKEIKGTEIIKDEQYKNLIKSLTKENIEEEIKLPENLENILRYYQKTGVKWLKVLDYYHFGGILADDMGLRKDHTNSLHNNRILGRYKKTK